MSDSGAVRSESAMHLRPLLEVRDLRTYLHTRWGVVKAVDGVSLSLKTGESFGLVGESGCGKTMFGLSLLRLLPEPVGRIVGGQILFEGEDLVSKSPKEMTKIRGRCISIVLQDPMSSLDPVFTIGMQLLETIEMDKRTKRAALKEMAVELLRLVRIPAAVERLRNYPFEMSGGMRQRVVGAIALARQPRLLIADEPTTSLDVTTQANYLRLLKDLQQRLDLALIFITHDFGVVSRVCDKVGVMYAGRLVEVASVREIFNNPLHPYTQALIDSVPKLEKRVARLASIKGQPPTLNSLPPNCAFEPRCSQRDGKCQPEFPPAIQVAKDHTVSCWRYGD